MVNTLFGLLILACCATRRTKPYESSQIVGRVSDFDTGISIRKIDRQKSTMVYNVPPKGWETQPLRRSMCGEHPPTIYTLRWVLLRFLFQ